MGVSNSDARSLIRDISKLASDGNTKHIGILSDHKRFSIRVGVVLLVVNTLLTSDLWASLTKDAPSGWLQYSGLALSLLAAVVSGLAVALDLRRQNELSLEAAKVYAGVVFEATKFRITSLSTESSGTLPSKDENELFRIYKLYNEMANKAGDRLAQLQDTSIWSEKAARENRVDDKEDPALAAGVRAGERRNKS